MYTVKQLSELAGISVRALHHYDELGLLVPSGRSGGGYRLYSGDDLRRLREIVAWRRLGFSLRETGALLDDPAYDREAALRRQRELVDGKRAALAAVIAALDEAIADEQARPGARTALDGRADPYAEETERRYGDTSQYAEARRRTARYGQAEWTQLSAEADEIAGAFSRLLRAGKSPEDAEALAVAERHRAFIARWFYDCPPALHRGLGELYAADERFRRNWDRHGDGLAEFVRDAVVANAAAR